MSENLVKLPYRTDDTRKILKLRPEATNENKLQDQIEGIPIIIQSENDSEAGSILPGKNFFE